jgi:ankyrin repeat protein
MPLLYAIKKFRYNIVQYLIKQGAPYSILDKYSLTPLDIAREKGLIALAKLLEERGAKTRVDLILEIRDR